MGESIQDIATLSPTKRALFELLLKEKGLNVSRIQKILRCSESQSYPLSFAQQRLWFLDRLEPGNPVYNETTTVRLTGRLNLVALELSLNEIVRRHEILRTTYALVGAEPVQYISPSQTISLSVTDLRNLPVEERERSFWQLSTQKAQQPFDLETGPLLRANLFQLDEESYVLGLIIHHIITDGWSSRILIREMTALYEYYSAGKPSLLPELSIQYIDFAGWQREWMQGEVLNQQLSYWKKHLGGRLPVLDLPTDRPRPQVQTFRGARQSLTLSPELSTALATFSRAEGVTLYMTLLAAFQTLLMRLSGQDDIIVGSPIAGRNRAEIEGLIGFFINTLVLRTNLAGNPTFKEVLQRVRQVALDAYAHQDLPFEKLVEELQPERDLSRTPLFQVFFNMLSFEQNSIEISGLTVETLPRPELESKFDITLYARENPERTQLEFVYNADLFEPARMVEMLAQLQHILAQVVKKPEEKIAEISLVTSSVQARLPNPHQTLNDSWEGAVHTQFSQQANRVGNSTAIIDRQGSLTYSELDKISNQLADYLQKHGIGSQDVVAIYAHRSAPIVVALLGILKAGAAFVILDAKYPAERLIDCVKLAQPKGWLQMSAGGNLPDSLETFIGTLSTQCRLNLPESAAQIGELLKDYSTENTHTEINPDDLAYIAFTSGSTGKPKGILGTHKPLSHFLQWHAQTFNLNESDRFSVLSGLAHDPLLRDIFTPLWLGATLCIPTPKEIGTPGKLGEWMKQQQITISHLTPAMGQLLTETSQTQQLTNLRYAFFGGDILSIRDVEKLRNIAPNVTCVNFYGATETPQAMGYYIVSNQKLEEHRNTATHQPENSLIPQSRTQSRIPLGQGIEDVQLLILNSSHRLAGIGEIGEIYIRTSYLSQGYLGDESLTTSRFITNPFTNIPSDRLYKTGDLGRYLSDGNISVSGRADNQIKIRGFRIEPGEIETVLCQHTNVRQSVVIAREDIPAEKRLVAYLVPIPEFGTVDSALSTQQSELLSELRDFVKEKLPDYMVPSAFVMLESVPLTPNGKIDRKALPAPEYRSESENSFIAPRDDLEHQLIEIWETLIHVKPIGVKDNFFELGGHSLLALRLFNQIQEKFDKLLPLATLFQAPTVEQLANILRSEGSSVPIRSLVPIQPNGSKTPLFCIHAIGGNVLSYQGVAAYLSKDQPVYGLQARGVDAQQTPHTRVEDMASDYIKEIRTVQPEGPYLLAGHSLGGIIAFEMAQQLVRGGHKVGLVAVFDTFSPLAFGKGTPPKSYQFDIHRLNLSRLNRKDKVLYITDRVYWKIEGFIQKIWKKVYKLTGRTLPDPLPEHFKKIEIANRVAATNYVPQIYPGRVTLLRAIERPTTKYYEPLLGWGEIAAAGVEVQEIPGHHKTIILEPRVRCLAETLQACLERVQAEER
ncbi:non-ribosomal peptide synthetase [Microcoleus sp. FACHB-672]|uniref:non-ribosomal peptide synthetase n=1 Tax=Microcoleus sp. FACHB-672 TaxID=2692825 RepID=UPI0016836F15|nr:non-ribosomal peptide synthetase [Microcoleus sp. FACHB-672]MBD2040987.1 amino acid adenylation domain-containing protein [Microcoleus sp. FACHB-672]